MGCDMVQTGIVMAGKPAWCQVQVHKGVCSSQDQAVQAQDLVVQLVQEGAEEHKGVVLGADLGKAPALAHGHAGVRCIIPQPCTVSQPCWGAPPCLGPGMGGVGGWGGGWGRRSCFGVGWDGVSHKGMQGCSDLAACMTHHILCSLHVLIESCARSVQSKGC